MAKTDDAISAFCKIAFFPQNSPTQQSSSSFFSSAGKLVSYHVEDGSHLFAGETYATVEVMKLVMEMKVTESGCIHFIKRPGALLESGGVIAHLTLDDPSRVSRAEVFQGNGFPADPQPPLMGNEGNRQISTAGVNKLNHVFQRAFRELKEILNGFSIPEPYYSERLAITLNLFLACLRDPMLPLMELQEAISTCASRLPVRVERALKQLMAAYASNITSVLCKFPYMAITNVLDQHAACLQRAADKENFLHATEVRRWSAQARRQVVFTVGGQLLFSVTLEVILFVFSECSKETQLRREYI